MEKLSKTLIFWYYGAFLLAVASATLGYFCLERGWLVIAPQTDANIAIYTILILYVIISTPLILKFFSKKVEKLRALDDENEKLRRYACLAKIRLSIVGFGLITSMFFYYVLCETSLLWLGGIAAVALIFCKPTKAKIEQDLQKIDNETIENE